MNIDDLINELETLNGMIALALIETKNSHLKLAEKKIDDILNMIEKEI